MAHYPYTHRLDAWAKFLKASIARQAVECRCRVHALPLAAQQQQRILQKLLLLHALRVLRSTVSRGLRGKGLGGRGLGGEFVGALGGG